VAALPSQQPHAAADLNTSPARSGVMLASPAGGPRRPGFRAWRLRPAEEIAGSWPLFTLTFTWTRATGSDSWNQYMVFMDGTRDLRGRLEGSSLVLGGGAARPL